MARYLDTKEPVTVESVEEPASWTDGTAEDHYDMTRMGKKQELRVGYPIRKTLWSTIQLNPTAQFPIHINLGIHGHDREYMGIHSLVH